jgi:mono/diheme cytochrome c family protein
MRTGVSHRDTGTQRKPIVGLCASVSLWPVTAVICVLLILTSLAAAQVRPTPQVPRRPTPTPRREPPPKTSSAPPTEEKEQPKDTQAKPAPQPASIAATSPNADAGAALFKKNGCYECHSNDAQGGPQGPRLGPNPIPLPRFLAYVRNPAGDMPPFTAKVISDDDLRSIYAFLQSRPAPPPVANIPLLAP